MRSRSRPHLTPFLAACLVAIGAASLAAPGVAAAADTVYMTNGSAAPDGRIRIDALDGTGTATDLFSSVENDPYGIALDLPAGKVYWADEASGKIRVGNLDGTGAPADLFPTTESHPEGVAVDPAAGRIYWADNGPTPNSGKIRVGNLDGTGTPADLFPTTTENGPSGVTIDPAAGKIYWADYQGGKIRVGNLNGTGTPTDLFPTLTADRPIGVAIDPAAGKIYWATNYLKDKIRVGNLDGTGTPTDLFATSSNDSSSPYGVALDPSAGQVYWGDNDDDEVFAGDLNGTGTPGALLPARALFLDILRAPLSRTPPRLSGGSRAAATLSCTRGGWAGDLLGAFLYRRPQRFAFRWSRDGRPIAGASASSYRARLAGNYRCRVTASNAAGPTGRTSAVHPVKPGKPTITRARVKRREQRARFSFRGGGASGFRCALLKPTHRVPKFTACTSPKTYRHLEPGDYTFEVRGSSSAGAGRAAKRAFTI